MEQLSEVFLRNAVNILAHTDNGLTGYKIIEYSVSFAKDFNVSIPIFSYPLNTSKKKVLLENLKVFNGEEQYQIIETLCEQLNNPDAEKLLNRLYSQYPCYANIRNLQTNLVSETEHLLKKYPKSHTNYCNALKKYSCSVFNRNLLDDLRVSLELLVKSLLNNNKSLENQKSMIGSFLKDRGISKETRNMVSCIIEIYVKFQNENVKHNDNNNINEIEIKYIIELTSSIIKMLIVLSDNP